MTSSQSQGWDLVIHVSSHSGGPPEWGVFFMNADDFMDMMDDQTRLREKDDEIEGLKARVEALRQIREEDKALITELCDALEFYVPFSSEPHYREILRRAREANGWRFFAVQYVPPLSCAREATR